jgi:hypothetical protein
VVVALACEASLTVSQAPRYHRSGVQLFKTIPAAVQAVASLVLVQMLIFPLNHIRVDECTFV